MVPTRSVQMLAVLVALGTACASDESPPTNGGGQGSGGSLSQGGTGGAAVQAGTGPSTAGSVSGGMANPGGAAGSATAGQGGSAGSSTGTGGGAGSAGSGGSGGAKQSAGCTKTPSLQNGTIDLPEGQYILNVPDDYDNTHPYRLILAYPWSGATASTVAGEDYYFGPLDTENTTIFVAPEASGVEFADAILEQLKGEFCIDESRIFATGFSLGGGAAMALGCQRADVFRGVAFFSGSAMGSACSGTLTKPIAYYASQASEDSGTGTPAPTSGRVKQAQFAEVNGCTADPMAAIFPAAGEPHKCTEYKDCSPGHPTKYCVFNGAHGWEPTDPGETMSWNAPEAWKFITQF